MYEDKTTAELVERRALTKRNSVTQAETVTQSTGGFGCGLSRIRKKAKAEPKLQFNNVFHPVTLEMLAAAYDNLNRKAAVGVDGETWDSYRGIS